MSLVATARKRVPLLFVEEVAWSPPIQNWVKINVDGSVIGNSAAACGGIVRSHEGSFVATWSVNLGG